MPIMTVQGLADPAWGTLGIEVPAYDVAAVRKATLRAPRWVHFGAGNIFRAYIARLQHQLLAAGEAETGIVAAEGFDAEIIDEIYRPHDDLTLLVTLEGSGALTRLVHGGIGASFKALPGEAEEWRGLCEVFGRPSLQMCSMTVTEKGYVLRDMRGDFLPAVAADMEQGPEAPQHVVAVLAALLRHRWRQGGAPLAMVSLDNCSRNGDKLRDALMEVAGAWRRRGQVEEAFYAWLEDPAKVSFPLTMIDKITPSPIPALAEELEKEGVAGMGIVKTARRTVIAPYANAEKAEYLVVEDDFPGGRPPLEKAGVLFTDRETVNKCEIMKVSAGLNPLHNALAVYGHLLSIETIDGAMRDAQLGALARRLAYQESLPAVEDPGIIDARAFMDEVLDERFPNVYIHDTVQRVATDISQNISIRFGNTIRTSRSRADLGTARLVALPLAIAGFCRYLMGVDDEGRPLTMSPDPMQAELTEMLSSVRLGQPESYTGQVLPILKNPQIFTVDLFEDDLGGRIEGYFKEMIAGPGAVRATLKREL